MHHTNHYKYPTSASSAVAAVAEKPHRYKTWLAVAAALMLVAVVATALALTMPAQTLEAKTYCGQTEHVHSDACYTTTTTPVVELACDYQKNGEGEGSATTTIAAAYANDADFFDANVADNATDKSGEGAAITTTQITQADFILHQHNGYCYDAAGTLICGLTERVAHAHTDACYTNGSLTCTLPEIQAHVHSEACFTNGTMTCGLPQVVEHNHTADCVQTTPVSQQVKTLACTQEEHSHSDQCYTAPEGLSFTYEDDLVSGEVVVPYSSELPDDLSLDVVAIDEDADNYDDLEASTDAALYDADLARLDMQLYQLDWQSNGESYTLPEGVEPTVSLTMLSSLDDDSEATVQGIVLDEATDGQSESTETNEVTSSDAAENNEENAEGVSDEAVEAVAVASTGNARAYKARLMAASSNNTITATLYSGSSVAGIMATSTTAEETKGYYKRITSLDELLNLTAGSTSGDPSVATMNSWNKFVIVFTNGMYALEGSNACPAGYKSKWTGVSYPGFALHKVDIQQTAGDGNTDYVTISEVALNGNSAVYGGKTYTPGTTYDNKLVYSPSVTPHTNYTIQGYNGASGSYILREIGDNANNTKSWAYVDPGDLDSSSNIASGDSSDKWSFEYNSDRQVFYLKIGNYGYLSTNIEPPDSEYDMYGGQLGTLDSVSLRTQNESAKVTVEKNLTESHGSDKTNNPEIQIYVYKEVALKVPNINLENATQSLLPRAEKPKYDDIQDVSKEQDGTSATGYDYASDPSTSNIESLFSAQSLTFEQQQQNDGRIVTDKSVIYGQDDYEAFDSYSEGEFSTTLSALGQEWTVSDKENVETPIDVMFLLDLSGSMTDVAVTPKETLSQDEVLISRWKASIEAVDAAMVEVLEQNPQNRVGVVVFSNTAETLLPLGRYKLYDGQVDGLESYYKGFITYKLDGFRTEKTGTYTGYQFYDQQYVRVHPALMEENNSGAYVLSGSANNTAWTSGIWSATYTQVGLQQVYNEFAKITDTSTTVKLSTGETTVVNRKPVFVMLTDGEPTLGTYNYMDPINGPRYGIGTSGENGMLGYYTILSANYFKNMTSIHYGTSTAFYTIGIGVKSEGTGSYSVEANKEHATSYYADDSYRRAVLDPTAAKVNELNRDTPDYSAYSDNSLTYQNMTISYTTASKLLYSLLEGGSSTSYVQNIEYMIQGSDEYGNVYEQWLRAISNPFTNYSYADASMFYGDIDEGTLSQYLGQIVENVQIVNNYGFLLKEGTNVEITDSIGKDMHVIENSLEDGSKSDFVLSYFGTLYKNPTKVTGDTNDPLLGSYVEYTWNATATRQDSDAKGKGQTIDLSQIKVRLYTDSAGNQTVKFIIPEKAMPTYYPDLYKSFYYEELPVRLIYKVGPTETAASGLTAGQSKTLYTNQYYKDSLNNDILCASTKATFTPDSSNPYYASLPVTSVDKANNATETVTTSFKESAFSKTTIGSVAVTQELGNNGKLTIKDVTSLTIKKQWDDAVTSKAENILISVFGKKIYDDGGVENENRTTQIHYLGTVTLNDANSWERTINNLETGGTDDGRAYTWQYYVSESPTGKYNYDDEYLDSAGNVITYETYQVAVAGVGELNLGSANDTFYKGACLRMYPAAGTVTVVNHPLSFTVQKEWATGNASTDSVDINLYMRVVSAGEKGVLGTQKIATASLGTSNSWQYTYDKALNYAGDFYYNSNDAAFYDYYIEELPSDKYDATYTDSYGNAVEPVTLTLDDGSTVNAYPVSTKITITNTPHFTLPNFGGEGTFAYTLGGIVLTVGATVALCIYRRTRLRTWGRGGELC